MIGTSIPEYIIIRVSILGLRAITPLSIFYCSLSIAEPPSSGFTKFLLVWSITEAAFWLLVFIPRKRALQASASHPPPLEEEDRKELFWKCWAKIPEPETYLSKWFLRARPWEVRRENVKDFFRWALLYKGDEIPAKVVPGQQEQEEELVRKQREQSELDEYVDGVQTLLGRTLEPGRGPAKCLRLTVDQVNMLHRPFLWYLVRRPGRGYILAGTNLGRLS